MSVLPTILDTIVLLTVITERPMVLMMVAPDVKEDAVSVDPKRKGANNVLPNRVDAVVEVTERDVP